LSVDHRELGCEIARGTAQGAGSLEKQGGAINTTGLQHIRKKEKWSPTQNV